MKGLYRRYISILAAGAGIGTVSILLLSSKQPTSSNEVELQTLVLKGPDGKPAIVFDASSGLPTVKFFDTMGHVNLELIGGECPAITMKSPEQKEMIHITLLQEGNPVLSLKDATGVSRMQLQGGDSPAIFLKNGQNEVIATMLTIQDGGAAVGLADKDGDVAAFLRGGASPSISFFQKSTEPLAAIGISQRVPHLLVTSPTTKDNLVLHGGDPTSVLFVDEQGEIPVLLSKHGLFQGKKPASPAQSSAEEKIFTWDELLNSLKDIKLNKR